MKKLSNLDAFQIAAFLENAATVLAGTELSAIDPAVRTDLLASLGTLPASITTAANDAVVQKNKAEAAVAARDDLVAQALIVLRALRGFLEASNAPKEQWELAGFDSLDGSRNTYVANPPSGLVLRAFSPASVKGKFKGNNTSGSGMAARG